AKTVERVSAPAQEYDRHCTGDSAVFIRRCRESSGGISPFPRKVAREPEAARPVGLERMRGPRTTKDRSITESRPELKMRAKQDVEKRREIRPPACQPGDKFSFGKINAGVVPRRAIGGSSTSW